MRGCVIGGAALQCAWLLAAGGGSWTQRLVWAAGCALLLIAPLRVCRRQLQPAPAMTSIAGGVGGLGMLCGALLDRHLHPSVLQSCHAQLSAAAWPEWNWMNGLMFATCVPSCVYLCPLCGKLGARALVHAVSALGMFAGMLAGGWALAQLAGQVGSASYNGSMHLAMLTGMMVGTLAVTACFDRGEQL